MCKTDPALVHTLGGLPDAQNGDSVYRRLTQATSLRFVRGVGGQLGRAPALRVGKVTFGRSVRVKNYVRQFTGSPLALEQCLQLTRGAAVVQVRQTQRDKRAIPAPLVGI